MPPSELATVLEDIYGPVSNLTFYHLLSEQFDILSLALMREKDCESLRIHAGLEVVTRSIRKTLLNLAHAKLQIARCFGKQLNYKIAGYVELFFNTNKIHM